MAQSVTLPLEIEEETIEAIASETRRALSKHGDHDKEHTDILWTLIAGEEMGEINEAVLNCVDSRPGAEAHLDEELVQLVTVLVRWIQVRRQRVKP